MNSHNNLYTVTNYIIIFTLLCFFFQMYYIQEPINYGLNILIVELSNHYYYQLLSTIFLHASIEHLLMNMIALWQFGNLLEYSFGQTKILTIYILGGLLTSFFTLIYLYFFIFPVNPYINVIGASGAISFLMGYSAYHFKKYRMGIFIFIIIISFIPFLFGMPIAWYSHLIGFGLGFIISFLKF